MDHFSERPISSPITLSTATCARGGCAERTNNIAPFGLCAKHFRAYQAGLAQRAWLADVIRAALDIDEIAKQVLQILSTSDSLDELDPALLSQDDLVGFVLDLLAEPLPSARCTLDLLGVLQ